MRNVSKLFLVIEATYYCKSYNQTTRGPHNLLTGHNNLTDTVFGNYNV